MSEVTIGLLGLAVVLVLFLTGIELAFAMALVGFHRVQLHRLA